MGLRRMQSENYGERKEVQVTFENAVEKTRQELQKEGFGVLTEIDVKATLKKKLDVDYDNYIILGACNPQFAHKALQVEKEIGLMLPCNVIVYEQNDKVFVSAIKPSKAMAMIENDELRCIAGEVEQKLKRVIDNV
jgi:uncharacterized protein (DUF302 family)